MHELLLNAVVQISSNISTKTVVSQGGASSIEFGTTRTSMGVQKKAGLLKFTLPETELRRKVCVQTRWPKHLAELLQIYGPEGERQIHRILKEVESSTDFILSEEEISGAP